MVRNILLLVALCLSFFVANAQWSSNSAINNQVSTSTVDQLGPKIIRDGNGGYIIAWTEKIANDNNIYIQKMDANGLKQWGVSGTDVCVNANNQILSGLVSDGNGGAIVVWEDSTGTGGGGIYGENDIYAQRISASGTKMWTAAGVSVCSVADVQSYVNIISDNNGGAIITWQDYRNNGYIGSDIYAQRLSSAGLPLWAVDGKVICSAVNPQVHPRICSDNLGGAFIAWEDYRGYSQSEIYLQRIDLSGNTLFAANGVIMCTAVNDQLFPEIIADGAGGAFLSWYDKRINGNTGVGDIYGQRVNATGAIQWGVAGLSLCNATGDQFTSFANLNCMISDGLGGFYMTWNDLRLGNHDVYIQRFGANGAALWTANGVSVNNNSFNELYPSLALDASNGVYVSWDRYNLAAIDIYGQHYTSAGAPLWSANGIPLANASNSQYNNQIVSTTDGNAILAFNDKRNNLNLNIYAQKVISSGTCVAPVVTISTASTTVCTGTPVTLTAGGASTYVWTGLGAGAVKTVFPAVSNTYTVTGTATDGCSASTTIAITVNSLPVVSISPSTTSTCSGGAVTLTANGANTYVWTNNAATGSPITVNPTTNTTYTVTGTSTNGCTATSTQLITALSLPVLSVSPTVVTVCPGASATITASGAASYAWSNLGTSASQVVSPSVTTTYTVTGTASNGCTNTATRTVNVNSAPNVTITPATAVICEGQSITLTASGASTYNWGTTLGTGNVKTVTPTTTTTYTITGTSAVGCTGTTTKTVTVNPLPLVSITPSSPTICAGETATLTANGATTYLWSNNSTNGAILITPSATTTYTVTGTSSGCSSTSTLTMAVNAGPTISVSPTTSTICNGASVLITATGASNFVWSNSVTTASQTVTPTTNTTYTVTGTAANGCTASATSSIIVNSVPTVGILPTIATICEGNSITLTATGANTYVWSNLASGNVQVFGPLTTTTYTVTGTSVNGCTATATRTINVNALPVLSVLPTNSTLCAGGTLILTASGAQNYVWTGLGNLPTQSISPATTTTYTVTGTSSAGCTSSATHLVTVNPNPVVNATTTANSICSGNTVTLNASGAANYTWSTNATGASVTLTPSSTTTYTVTGTNASGCSATSTVQITVHNLPVVSATASQNSVCSNTAVLLTASGASSYSWNNAVNGATQTVTPASTSSYIVTGTDANGCSATSSVTIIVNPCNISLDVKVYVEGYYLGSGEMQPVLLNAGIGTSTTEADSINVQVKSSLPPYATEYNEMVILNTNGTAHLNLPPSLINGSYYLAIKQRNSLETWSANPILFLSSGVSYDFTTDANKAYGDNQIMLEPGVFGMYSGDINGDFTIDAFDYIEMDPDILFGNFGYLTTDLNGDGAVDAFDYLKLQSNIDNGVGTMAP